MRNRLDPKPVTDPPEPPTRVASPDGRWAYSCMTETASSRSSMRSTRDRKAFCIDLHDPSCGRGAVYDLRLAVAAGDPPGPSPLWPAIGLGLFACAVALWWLGPAARGTSSCELSESEAP